MSKDRDNPPPISRSIYDRLHIEAMTREWFAGPKPDLDGYLDVLRRRLARAALVPDAEAVPVAWQSRRILTSSRRVVTDWDHARRSKRDAEQDSILRSFSDETCEFRPLYTAPPTATSAPVSPVSGEVSEAEVEQVAWAIWNLCNPREPGIVYKTWDEWPETPKQASLQYETHSRQDYRDQARAALRAAARVRPASPDSEGWPAERERCAAVALSFGPKSAWPVAIAAAIREQPTPTPTGPAVNPAATARSWTLPGDLPATPRDAIAAARADERERAAKVADETAATCQVGGNSYRVGTEIEQRWSARASTARAIADRIRALGPVPSTDAS